MTELPCYRLARVAMACRWEVVAVGPRPLVNRSAAEAALAEVERYETMLSPFRADSEISRLNRAAAGEPVPLSGEVMAVMRLCRDLHEVTGGAFDCTVWPLLELWGFRGEPPATPPTDAALAAALADVGQPLLELLEERFIVKHRPGVRVDLGAVGKGCAVDAAFEALLDHGVDGLVHGGASSVRAAGVAPDGTPWPVAIDHPSRPERLAIKALSGRALGVSRPSGREVRRGGEAYGHVLDPRTGRPVAGALQAVVCGPTAGVADALATALLIDPTAADRASERWPGIEWLRVTASEITRRGDWTPAQE